MLGCSRRLVVSLFVVGLAFGLSSCASSNERKIVGHWEATGGPLVDQFKSSLPKADDPKAIVNCMIQFKADGDFAMGWRVANFYIPLMSGKYKLGQGDLVELTDLKINKAAGEHASTPNMNVKIDISGDALTFTDGTGDTKFKRIQPPPTKAAPAPTTAK